MVLEHTNGSARMVNPFDVIPAVVVDVREESPLIRTLTLKPERDLSFEAGQFIELSVPGVGEAPFTPSSSPYVRETLDVTIMRVGYVTDHVHRARVGDRMGLRGPYGTRYPLERFEGRPVLILGGGCGLAPLRALFLTLLHDPARFPEITFCMGAKTPEDCLYKDAVTAWRRHPQVRLLRAVDIVPDGQHWDEEVDVVTKLLAHLDPPTEHSPAVVCGPPIMMRFATKGLLEGGYMPRDIYLSMEKKMYCGFGQCRHCLVGGYYACRDGPVFTYEQLADVEEIWD